MIYHLRPGTAPPHSTAGAFAWLGGLVLLVDGGLTGGRDVRGARFLEQVLGLLRLLRRIAVDREQDPSALEDPLVPLGFELRYSHSNQRPGHAAHRAPCARPRQSGHDGARRDEWPQPRNGERAD